MQFLAYKRIPIGSWQSLSRYGCYLRVASGQLLSGGATIPVLDAGALGAVGTAAQAIGISMLGDCPVL